MHLPLTCILVCKGQCILKGTLSLRSIHHTCIKIIEHEGNSSQKMDTGWLNIDVTKETEAIKPLQVIHTRGYNNITK
jgi:hypothetical protein